MNIKADPDRMAVVLAAIACLIASILFDDSGSLGLKLSLLAYILSMYLILRDQGILGGK